MSRSISRDRSERTSSLQYVRQCFWSLLMFHFLLFFFFLGSPPRPSTKSQSLVPIIPHFFNFLLELLMTYICRFFTCFFFEDRSLSEKNPAYTQRSRDRIDKVIHTNDFFFFVPFICFHVVVFSGRHTNYTTLSREFSFDKFLWYFNLFLSRRCRLYF